MSLEEQLAQYQADLADLPGDMGRQMAEEEAAYGELEQNIVTGVPFGGALEEPQMPDMLDVPELDVMDDDQVVAEVSGQLKSSLDGTDGELVGNWRMALRYYKGFADSDTATPDVDGARFGCIDKDTGLANTVSMDVADTIEAIMAQIMPAFEAGCVFGFGAVGQTNEELTADEPQAELESRAVNHMLMSKNPGYAILQSMFRDALLMRCGYVKVVPRDEISVQVEEYQGLTPQDYLLLAMDPNVSIGRVGETYMVRRYSQKRVIAIEPCPQEEMKISNGWHSPFLDGVPFIAHSRIVRRSDLVEMGYDRELVDSLPTESQETMEVAVERSTYSNENQYYDAMTGSEPVRYSECYVRLDYDGDGLAEQRKVCLGGQNTLMANEPVPEQPFVMAVPILRSHRMTGFSVFDRQRDVQDVKTETLNQHIDNLRWCNMPDVDAVDKQVNYEDLLARRPGGINRVRQAGSIQRNAPIPVGGDALQLMDYMDKMRSERGGASLDLQSAQMQVQGDSAHGVERQMSARELMASFMASTMVSTGFIPLVKLLHREMRRNPQQMVLRSESGAVPVDSSQWKEREDVSVTSAITIGDQMRRLQALSAVSAQQQQLMQAGQDNVLVDLSGVYNAMLDAARMARLPNPSQYFVDPTSQQAQQAIQAKQQQAQQAQQQQEQQIAMQQQFQWALAQMQREMAQMREQSRLMIEWAKLNQKDKSDAAKLAEDARQANQETATDLTKLEVESGQNVPGSAV